MRRSIIRGSFLVLVLALGFIGGQLSAAQPKMQAALTNLRQARSNLQAATADKGGHRERAIELVNQAIDQVEEGMRYDRRH
jgi:hypothetical protein